MRAAKLLTFSFLIMMLPATVTVAAPAAQLRFDTLTTGSGLSSSSVSGICQAGTGFLWFGTQAGLNRYDGRNVPVYEDQPFQPNSLVQNQIQTMFDDTDGSLWIGTCGGLSRYLPGSDSFETWQTGGARRVALGSNNVMTISEDPDRPGLLWVGTWGGGLLLFSRSPFTISQYTADQQESIPNNIVYSLYQDRGGVLWIGTNGGGVAKLVDWQNRYTYYRHLNDDPASIPAGKITAMTQDAEGRIWYAVYNAGLDLYNPATDGFSHTSVSVESSPIRDGVIDRFFEDSEGTIWIGTYTHGLYRFDSDLKSYLHFGTNEPPPRRISNDLIRVIHEDPEGTIWIGTNNGLFRYRSDTLTAFVPGKPAHESISEGSVRDIHEGPNGTLYLATMGGGVNILKKATGRFDCLTTEDGLASNMVLGIIENGNTFFFMTQRGVSVYAPATMNFQTLNESNGLLSNELTDGHMIDSRGVLHLGSASGVTLVPQFTAIPEGPVPPIVITDLQVLGKEHAQASTAPGNYGPIALPYRSNTVSVEFAVLDFANPRQNQYSIKLEGLDKSWHDLTNRNYVTFSGLAPGSYTLRVTGAGSRNNWNQGGLSLPITVLRPWWTTPPAFAVYLLIAALIVLFIVLRYNRARRDATARAEAHAAQTRELEIRVRERTAQIEAARRVAEEATAAKSSFMARMSHEIRTPLNGVHGMLTLLRRTELSREQARCVDFARAASENLYNIVSDVLDFERIMAGRLSVSITPFSIRQALQFVVGIYGPQAADKGIDLRLDSAEDVPQTVVGDRTRTIQVVTNLVSNALKYTDRGKIQVALSNAEEPSHDRARLAISVTDTGMGIPSDQLEAIFEQFAQLNTGEARQNLGTGLGLSIVKQLCLLMEGEVQVESTPGEGSCFTVTLPYGIEESDLIPEALAEASVRRTAEPASAESAAKNAAAAARAADGADARRAGTVRILVAEDEGINRLFITSILRSKGFKVSAVGNGAEAASLAASEHFDLVLMDIGMPVLGGLEATARIRSEEFTSGRSRTPILALTAYAYKSDIDTCFEAGMDDFISKPLDEALLFEKIAEWTDHRN